MQSSAGTKKAINLYKREVGTSLLNNQRQHRSLHIQTGCAALRIVLVTVPRVPATWGGQG